MRTFCIIALLAIIATFSSDTATAATKRYTFKKGQLVKVSGKSCGLIAGSWRGVVKSGRKYVRTRSSSHCRRLLKPGLVKNRGISVIPNLSALVKQRTSPAFSATVSGTPPTLNEIPEIVKTLFWVNNEVDAIGSGSPSGEQCDDFFHGTSDGDSAGLIGCVGVESVGRAFQSVLDGAAGTCYMSKIASNSALSSGGIEILSGSLPENSISKLFSTPSGSSPRTVKVVISGFPGDGGDQTGFIVIDSAAKLTQDGNQYGYTSYFCNAGTSTPANYERTTVSLDGRFKLSGYNRSGDHEFKNAIEASLTQSGSNILFDLSKKRVAKTASKDESDNRFKVQVAVNPDNTIDSKVKERFGESRREVVSSARFSGNDVTTLRVLESASKARFDDLREEAAFDYRDSAYVAAPGSALLSKISDDALDDSFFETEDEVEPSFSDKSCNADADITLRLNFSVATLAAIAAECETKRLSEQSFCFENTDIGTALVQYPLTCGG